MLPGRLLIVATDGQGRASFADLAITGTGSHTLRFTAPGLAPATSQGFMVETPPREPAKAYLVWTPRVLSAAAGGTVTLDAFVPGAPTAVRMALAGGGTTELAHDGAYRWTATLQAAEVLSGYQTGDAHQRGHLLLHQRYERRDDEGEPVGQQRRQLVAKRLPGPRGKHGEHVAASEQRAQHFELMNAKRGLPEPLREDRAGGREAAGERGHAAKKTGPGQRTGARTTPWVAELRDRTAGTHARSLQSTGYFETVFTTVAAAGVRFR